ncbi:CPBP family intramembrane glutamic endopeptidase [Luteibacter yeojuensis]|uniref:CPBP family intramembrane metalloprotease n=1 Tax=Luteibacter yeojuensis TaxID=345309 RepID=A0A7X5QU07_9GAMM|nr:CPBP family intramembrane glutamic endopeptidase [Luteibacter yeojuensis]NID15329.1 CPBP family intramembrane metalloprotease [Luteibacter yeojuensis]
MTDDYLPASPSPTALAPPRTPGVVETTLCIAAYFGLQFAFGGLFGGISMQIARSFPGHVPPAPDRLIVVVILTVLCAAVVVSWLLLRRWGAARATDPGPAGLGFTPPAGRFIVLASALGVAAPVIGGLLTQLLAGDHTVSQAVSDIADKADIGMRVALLPVVVLIGPAVEELLFRGALLSILRTRLGDGWAIGLSALIFGTIHLPDLAWLWYAVPNLVLVGLFCAWLRVRSGSIWPAFVAHAANNALATVAWFTVAAGS